MPWLLASPEHQHPWYWLCRIGTFYVLVLHEEWCQLPVSWQLGGMVYNVRCREGISEEMWFRDVVSLYVIFTHFRYRFQRKVLSWTKDYSWLQTYFRQDLFPAHSFSGRQFHAIVIFRLKPISDLDSGSLPRLYGEFIYGKLKIVVP